MKSLEPVTVAAEQLHVRPSTTGDALVHLDSIKLSPLRVSASVDVIKVEHANVGDATPGALRAKRFQRGSTPFGQRLAAPLALVLTGVFQVAILPAAASLGLLGLLSVRHERNRSKGIRKSVEYDELMSR